MNKPQPLVINEKLLNEGPADLIQEIFALLKKQLPENQRLLNQAMAARQWKEARAELHKLQGSCAYCGLDRLAIAASELYTAIKNATPPYQDLLDRFNTEIEAVMSELNRISRRSSG